MTRPAPGSLLLVVAVVVLMVFAATSCIAPIVPDAKDSADEQQDPNLEEATSTPTPTNTPVPDPLLTTTPEPCLVIDKFGTIQDCELADFNSAQRDAACVPIVDYDGASAYDVVSSSGSQFQIGWSFGVNFSEPGTEDPNGPQRPLACLHIYQRDDSEQEFVAIDHGGILVDRCEATTAGVVIEYAPVGEAAFCTDGRVRCSTNIGAWLTDPEVKAYVALDNPITDAFTVGGLLDSMVSQGNDAPYPHLALVAQAEWREDLGACAGQSLVQPLVKAYPEGVTGTIHQLDALLTDQSSTRITYATNVCPPLPSWIVGEELRIWYQLLKSNDVTEQSYLADGKMTCVAASSPSDIKYWIGPGWVDIGARGGESLGANISGILIDPNDSVPPE